MWKTASLIVLAGGRSRRMRAPKPLLPAPDRPLIERVLAQLDGRFAETLISVSKGGTLPGLPGRQVEDEVAGRGPIEGLRRGLAAASHPAAVVIACDIPDIDLGVLGRLMRAAAGVEIAVPVTPGGNFEPLFAVYKKAVLPVIDRLVASGENSLIPLFRACRTRTLPLADAAWLKNLNTPADYARFLRGVKS